ncbi:TPA: hypothetical protein N0F65_008364 [Lagenidium giganteum]|uniref:WW domain-containing protein n=1 Tax=Lagenidium giganteum TaxID=4803 RepID=A0AAV2YPB5_9STRA|nr:TPA: hypothetical protein N0F65_008364 [Lagenidium giganteum]
MTERGSSDAMAEDHQQPHDDEHVQVIDGYELSHMESRNERVEAGNEWLSQRRRGTPVPSDLQPGSGHNAGGSVLRIPTLSMAKGAIAEENGDMLLESGQATSADDAAEVDELAVLDHLTISANEDGVETTHEEEEDDDGLGYAEEEDTGGDDGIEIEDDALVIVGQRFVVEPPPRVPLSEPTTAEDVLNGSVGEMEGSKKEHIRDASHPRPTTMLLETPVGAIVRELAVEHTLDVHNIAAEGTAQTQAGAVNPWVRCLTENGTPYYFNSQTQESQWTMPAEPAPVLETHHAHKSFTVEALFDAVAGVEPWTSQLEDILRSGMDVQAVNVDGLTPLHVAVENGDVRAAVTLLNYGASVEARSRHDVTPLMIACQSYHVDLVKMLVDYGADLGARDDTGNTLLHIAVMSRSDSVLFHLLELYDSSILSLGNAEDSTPLHLAAELGYTTGVSALLQYGASPEAEDVQGRSALVVSIMENQVECAQLLQQHVHSYHGSAHTYPQSTSPSTGVEDSETLATRLQYALQDYDASATELFFRYKMNVAADTSALQEKVRLQVAKEDLDARERDTRIFRDSVDALQLRCNMLETVARLAHDRLRRERADRQQYEEAIELQIQHTIAENRRLFGSLQQLRGSLSVNNNSVVANPPASLSSASDYNPLPDSVTSVPVNAHADSQELQVSASNVEPFDSVQPSSQVSPSRVDAVWNRFFENMSHAADRRAESTGSATYQSSSTLFDAIRKGEIDALKSLLLKGYSSNARDQAEKGTPLHLACELGDTEAVMLLCEFAADLESRDEDGNTALHMACLQGHFECTRFLLQSAANLAAVNNNGDTALHLAAWDGSSDCVSILIDYGVDVLAKNNYGQTALENVRTRSPFRHKFDELPASHPMKATLIILEVAEHKNTDHETVAEEDNVASEMPKDDKPQQSWKDWLLLSTGLSAFRGGANHEMGRTHNEDKVESDDSFGDNGSSENEDSPPASPHDLKRYHELKPPPAIEADLKVDDGSRIPRSVSSLSPPPPEVLDALEKTRTTWSLTPMAARQLLSPTGTQLKSTATHVRSRYVDTFNSP